MLVIKIATGYDIMLSIQDENFLKNITNICSYFIDKCKNKCYDNKTLDLGRKEIVPAFAFPKSLFVLLLAIKNKEDTDDHRPVHFIASERYSLRDDIVFRSIRITRKL